MSSPNPKRLPSSRYQNEAPIRRDARSLEIDLQRSVEQELEQLTLFLTHWVLTSGASSSRSDPHE